MMHAVLPLVLALLVVGLPTAATALTMGELQIHSKPDQPFQATVDLVLGEDEEIHSLVMGSPSDYALVHIPRPELAEQTTARLKQRDGKSVVWLQGSAPLRGRDPVLLLRIASNRQTYLPFFRVPVPLAVATRVEVAPSLRATPVAELPPPAAQPQQRAGNKREEKTTTHTKPAESRPAVEPPPVAESPPPAAQPQRRADKKREEKTTAAAKPAESRPSVAASPVVASGERVEQRPVVATPAEGRSAVVSAGEQQRIVKEKQAAEKSAAPPPAESRPAVAPPPVSEQQRVALQQAEKKGAVAGSGEARWVVEQSSLSGPAMYGPVRSGESLASIAASIARSSVLPTIQVQVALWRRNLDQFLLHNMHGLQIGSWLIIPTPDEMAQVNREEANALKEQHLEAWQRATTQQKPALGVATAAAETAHNAALPKPTPVKEVGAAPVATVESPPKPAPSLQKTASVEAAKPASPVQAVTEPAKPAAADTTAQESLVRIVGQLQGIHTLLEKNQGQLEHLIQRISTLEQAQEQVRRFEQRLTILEEHIPTTPPSGRRPSR
ncbi:MAG: hypothetical protein H7835_13110 [Magnetococcus sp. XQGC-1]